MILIKLSVAIIPLPLFTGECLCASHLGRETPPDILFSLIKEAYDDEDYEL